MDKRIFKTLITNVLIFAGGGKWWVLTNILTLAALCLVAKHYHLLRDIKATIGLEQKLPDDYWAVNGWNNTIEKLDYQCDVVFFGNSITRGSDFRMYFPNAKIVNCGYPGDNLKGMLMRIPPVRHLNPKAVFAMGGINGLANQSIDDFERLYHEFAQMLLDSIPQADIYLQSILPVNTEMKKDLDITPDKIIEANKVIKQFADVHERCYYVDLFSVYESNGIMPPKLTRDGIHLFPHAYDRWAEKIRPHIEKYCSSQK